LNSVVLIVCRVSLNLGLKVYAKKSRQNPKTLWEEIVIGTLAPDIIDTAKRDG
jgi:hypothetical protein